MGVGWHEAISTPIEVMYRDFAFHRIEHQMNAQAQAIQDARRT